MCLYFLRKALSAGRAWLLPDLLAHWQGAVPQGMMPDPAWLQGEVLMEGVCVCVGGGKIRGAKHKTKVDNALTAPLANTTRYVCLPHVQASAPCAALHMCRPGLTPPCMYVCSSCAGSTVNAFSRSRLPKDPEKCFSALFAARLRWDWQDLAPYLKDLQVCAVRCGLCAERAEVS